MRGSRFSSCSILGVSSTSEKTLSSIKSARSGEPASVRIEGPRRYMIPERLITYNRSLADLIDSQTRFHAGRQNSRQNSQGHGSGAHTFSEAVKAAGHTWVSSCPRIN
ncbi:hypothetical protein PTI98_009596 [Pleurotus ostreatus]|nr:hypothetical protein PTI98_009596 [Pleurotus ostreatus]